MAGYKGQRTRNLYGRLARAGLSYVMGKGGRSAKKKMYSKMGSRYKSATRRLTKYTRKKRGGPIHVAQQTGSDSYGSYYHTNLKKVNFQFLKNIEPLSLTVQDSGSSTCALGRQQAVIVGHTYSYDDMKQFLNQYNIPWISGTYNALPGYTTITQASNASFGINHVLMNSVCESTIVNGANTPMTVILYDIVSRLPQLYDATQGDPLETWQQASFQEGQSTTGTSAYLHIGTTPFQSNSFCKNYKVLKTTTVKLAEGQMHTHRFTNKSNFKVNLPYWIRLLSGGDTGTNANLIPKISTFTMAVFYGSPVVDSTDPTNVITTSVVKLNYINYNTYKIKYIPNNPKLQYAQQNLPITVAGVPESIQFYTGSTQGQSIA